MTRSLHNTDWLNKWMLALIPCGFSPRIWLSLSLMSMFWRMWWTWGSWTTSTLVSAGNKVIQDWTSSLMFQGWPVFSIIYTCIIYKSLRHAFMYDWRRGSSIVELYKVSATGCTGKSLFTLLGFQLLNGSFYSDDLWSWSMWICVKVEINSQICILN